MHLLYDCFLQKSIEINNISAFAREYNSQTGCIYDVLKGRKKTFRERFTTDTSLIYEFEDQNGKIYQCLSHHSLKYYFGREITARERNLLSNVKRGLKHEIIIDGVILKIKGRNLEETQEMGKKFRLKHKDKIQITAKRTREKHKEKRLAATREWRSKNKDHVREYNNKYALARREKDINFKIRMNMRSRLRQAMVNGKKSDSTLNLVGCNIEELRKYLEKQFKPGMTWENYGFGEGKWNIDHILPCNSFDLTLEENQRKCFHYTNLQPLWHEENMSKCAKII